MTALAFAQCDPRSLLLAGEGSFLRIFDPSSSRLLFSKRLFCTQAIHGIKGCDDGENSAAFAPVTPSSNFLIWGGRSICIVQIESHVDQSGGYNIRCDILGEEVLLLDWILDACFWSTTSAVSPMNTVPYAIIFTSHNVLSALYLRWSADLDTICSMSIVPFATGPQSILYSGHLISLDSDWLLIASGAVFGEVLVWACNRASHFSPSDNVTLGHLLYLFSGHDGSIFGVRISESSVAPNKDNPRRVLASCSDDRTIRLWNISNARSEISRLCRSNDSGSFAQTCTQKGASDVEPDKSRCLAMVVGHASRIWGLRFLASDGQSVRLISYGEDATTQIWRFDHEIKSVATFGTTSNRLRLEISQKYHIGKNIWAVATSHQEPSSSIFTGGADGRIASYIIGSGKSQSTGSLEGRLRNREAFSIDIIPNRSKNDETGYLARHRTVDTTVSGIFNAMQGDWELNRSLKSGIPTYPSGTFKGTANLISRPPTDVAYDAEYLYTEEGYLETEQGLCLQGSRRYVYRYERAKKEITAWFVRPGSEAAADYLFHNVDFNSAVSERQEQYEQDHALIQKASGYHLCIEDQYKAEYGFLQNRGVLEEWSLRYDVTGPEKDYSADARYTRSLTDKEKAAVDSSEVIAGINAEAHHTRLPRVTGTRPVHDSPKSYSWINKHELLATTAKGCILLGTLSEDTASHYDYFEEISWEEISQLNDLTSYSLTCSVEHLDCILLSGKQGVVYLYQNRQKTVNPIITLHCKVSGLFTQELLGSHVDKARKKSTGIVAACLGSPSVYMCTMHLDGSLRAEKAYISDLVGLKLPSHFVVTSAQWIGSDTFLALGSRSGALCVYKYPECTLSEARMTPFPCFRHVHGEDAITSIQKLPAYTSTSKVYFLTTGRNGRCAVHHLSQRPNYTSDHLRLETVHVLEPPFGPNIEGGLFDSLTKDLIVWGFRSKSFVVWNESKQKEVMEIECGGSHRSWAYRQNSSGKEGGAFVWTQASICNIHTQEQASHELIQPGGHGREIKAMAIYQADGQNHTHARKLIATGAEDTTVRIIMSSDDNSTRSDKWVCRGVMKSHTTGIQQLRWTPDGSFLFSAGGGEELLAWKVQPVPCIDVGVILFSRCPSVTEDSDLRVMDFDILIIEDDNSTTSERRFLMAVVYSDSSVRVCKFSLNVNDN